ncbi:hypothetical protein MRX96_003193 [Rhipicephalus microplus]|uniref:Uncharacterized protein n=1 Tax=Rhipicephalus microplus TaxID=6941 RepID=A0A9J6EGP2_RHIMP|nr:hypothetical protein HPB51_012070 [Rhipicephalus microplus]
MLSKWKASRQVQRHADSSYGHIGGATVSTSVVISDSCDTSSGTANSVNERQNPLEKEQSVSQNAASAGGSLVETEGSAVERSLSLPSCSGHSSKACQGKCRLRSGMGGLWKRLFEEAAETMSGAQTTQRERDVDDGQGVPVCRTCSFRRQLFEPESNKYHWWDPGPPRADGSEYNLAHVFW